MFFIVYKGAKGLGLDETKMGTAFAWAFGLGIGVGLLMIPTVLPYMRKQINIKYNEDGTLKPVREAKETNDRKKIIVFNTSNASPPTPPPPRLSPFYL